MQYVNACEHTHHHRDEKCEQAEEYAFADILPEMVHVYLQTREEHQIQKPHLAEYGERAVTVEYVEPVRPDSHTGDYHADDVGYLELVEYDRREQYYGHHDQEDRDRIGNQGCCADHRRKLFLVFENVSCNLYGIECRAFADLVADDPEG